MYMNSDMFLCLTASFVVMCGAMECICEQWCFYCALQLAFSTSLHTRYQLQSVQLLCGCSCDMNRTNEMLGNEKLAFLSYRYVPPIFHQFRIFVHLFKTPHTIHLVVFVLGNFLKLLLINISLFVGQSASYSNSWLNKEFSLNKRLSFAVSKVIDKSTQVKPFV